MRVAIVDDEPALRETLTMALEREGYDVTAYRNGQEAWQAFQTALPDLAVLDVSMPYLDGLELCKLIRTVSPAVPLLFLSSRADEIDRIVGLEVGGDDYLTKPFSIKELLVRIKVLWRRAARQLDSGKASPAQNLPVFVDEQGYQLWWRGAPVALTVTEFRIAAALFGTPGRVKTRDQLIEVAYQHPTYVEHRTMDTHIKRIRRKFEDLDPDFEAIAAVPGLGYKAVLP